MLALPFRRPEEMYDRIDDCYAERHERECWNDLFGVEQGVFLHVAVKGGMKAVVIRGQPIEDRNHPVR
jgi:hypothetical protein